MARLKKSEHPVSSNRVNEDTREQEKRSVAGLFLLRRAIRPSGILTYRSTSGEINAN
jgi:hypothetical protein